MPTNNTPVFRTLQEFPRDISTWLQWLEAQPSEEVSAILGRSYWVVRFDVVKELLEHPGWPLVDKIIKNSKQAGSLHLIEVKFLDNGNCEIALSESPWYNDFLTYSSTKDPKDLNTPIRVITFSNSGIIEDTTLSPISTPRLIDWPRQPQGSIDALEDMARHIPDATALINRRVKRWV